MLHRMPIRGAAAAIGALGLIGCAGGPSLQEEATYGPNPALPEPRPTPMTVDIAPARGWAEGEKPVPAAGLTVASYAEDLDHPRWMYVLPNGDVLVAETNAPERPAANTGIKGFFKKLVQQRAGAAPPSANRITLLRDANGDGTVELRNVLLSNLNSPFGMALVGNDLSTSPTPMQSCGFRIEAAPPASASPARRSLICRPVRSTTTGRRICSRAATAGACT